MGFFFLDDLQNDPPVYFFFFYVLNVSGNRDFTQITNTDLVQREKSKEHEVRKRINETYRKARRFIG